MVSADWTDWHSLSQLAEFSLCRLAVLLWYSCVTLVLHSWLLFKIFILGIPSYSICIHGFQIIPSLELLELSVVKTFSTLANVVQHPKTLPPEARYHPAFVVPSATHPNLFAVVVPAARNDGILQTPVICQSLKCTQPPPSFPAL